MSSAAKMPVKMKELTSEQNEIVLTLANDGISQRKIAETLGSQSVGL
jgi:transcriptional regulator